MAEVSEPFGLSRCTKRSANSRNSDGARHQTANRVERFGRAKIDKRQHNGHNHRHSHSIEWQWSAEDDCDFVEPWRKWQAAITSEGPGLARGWEELSMTALGSQTLDPTYLQQLS